MDIRKLQRAIVDGLEDVKAQDIAVFDTEHLTPLFERVIVASGTSNRQTKALAASVRDAVKSGGFSVLRTEGESNGEWIIVDCGAAVAHIMQPDIRRYYHLEELWGEKPVKMKFAVPGTRLVKASENQDEDKEPPQAARKVARKGTAGKPVTSKPVTAKKAGKAAGRTSAKPGAKTAANSAVKTAPKTGVKIATKTGVKTGDRVALYMPQKPVSQSLTFRSPFYYTRQVCHTKAFIIPVFYHSQLGCKGSESIVSYFGCCCSNATKQC